MEDEWQIVVDRLRGEHAYGARAGNWFAIWVFLVLSLVLGGAAEGYFRGWRTIRVTPVLIVVSGVGLVVGWVWIRTFNRMRYRFDSGSIECFTAWPLRSWKAWVEDIETARLEQSHGHWIMVLQLRGGGRKRIVLTKSMRGALSLA